MFKKSSRNTNQQLLFYKYIMLPDIFPLHYTQKDMHNSTIFLAENISSGMPFFLNQKI